MASVDVTVRGAGIFGLSIAWALVQRGARVQIVDPFGAGAGSSGGIVGALAPHVSPIHAQSGGVMLSQNHIPMSVATTDPAVPV